MKQILTYTLTGILALACVNCTTSYDAYGNPRQSVSPGGAVAGAAGAAALTYALTRDKKKNNNEARYSRGDFRPDDRDPRYHDRRRGSRDGYYDKYGNYRHC